MWIEELRLENIKCFESLTLKLGENGKPYPWVTLLGENGAGKTTVLQAMGLLLAGERTANNLLQNGQLESWVGKQGGHGEIFARLFRSGSDQLSSNALQQTIGEESSFFNCRFFLAGKNGSSVRGTTRDMQRGMPLAPNSITSDFQRNSVHATSREILYDGLHSKESIGWFGVGYGAFRRLSKDGYFTSQRPYFDRSENYNALFKEQSLDTFNAWMMYLDHIILKNGDERDKRHLAITKSVIDSLLPPGTAVLGAEPDGKIYFSTPNGKRPSTSLSDGYRSIIALAGDLIWRMIQAFPDSESPNHEQGVALIDELDIHLHPKWQRSIAEVLRSTFPNLQFIVATHSPIVAAGAGSDAVTYGFYQQDGKVEVERVDHLWAKSVDDILRSPAFGLVSEFSVETQAQIDRYFELRSKKKLNSEEQLELEGTYPYVREALGPGMDKTPLELEIDAYLQQQTK